MSRSSTQMKTPTVGFVSLGCPKATVDSEQILTRLKGEGYAISGSYQGADLVVVNTCGFIDAAVEESLDAIGPAMQSMMSAYMEQSQTMFQQMQEQIQGQTRNLFAGFQFPNAKASAEEKK